MNWQPIETAPDWEGFGRALMEDWPTGDIEGGTLFDMSLKYGLIREVPGGYDPDKHIDADCISPEIGDPWYEYAFGPERDATPGEHLPPAVKPLEWSEDHGDGYRIFYANTPVGRFAFGTDKLGQSYWQGNSPMDLGEDVASEAEAEKEAQAAYAAAIMEADIFKCLNLVQEGEPGEQPDTVHVAALAECLSSFLSHTDGWDEVQLRKRWGDDYVQNVLRSRAALRALEGGE